MGSTRSSEEKPEYIGCARIYSGRPDPTWQVKKDIALRLEEIWDFLEPLPGNHPSNPKLGYRGCFLTFTKDLEWFANDGVVTLKRAGKIETRRDEDRKFERMLLSSAPEGLLPQSLIQEQRDW